ncbi:MAG: hypothetical protein HYX21_03160 [Candidatus Yanofskybacteria bacterium]|nr:hypothetical protein [Candidatus Yanofskybacteria bacterium]
MKKIKNNRSDDHVFPDAWYPDSTPANVQRWTVPACRKCNAKLQVIEDELFIRWGICVEPNLEACRGIEAKALNRQFFLGVKDPRRFGRKLSTFNNVRSNMGQYDPKRTHKGFAPKEGVRGTLAVLTPNKTRRIFSEKLVRGTEYKLLGRFIPWTKRINIWYEMAEDTDKDYAFWRDIASRAKTVSLGPGFAVKCAINPNYPEQSFYQFEIWGHIKFFAFVHTKSFKRELLLFWSFIKWHIINLYKRFRF